MSRAALVLLALAVLTGCRVTLWSYEWQAGPPFDECEHDRETCYTAGDPEPLHNAAGGYAPACGELPGLLGDDC